MTDFGDEALSRQEEDLADIMVARRAHAAESNPPASDYCTSCKLAIEDERRAALPNTNICGGCATEIAGGRR
jgi:hypothetical protein